MQGNNGQIGSSIVWVDNMISHFEPLVAALRTRGHEVIPLEHIDEVDDALTGAAKRRRPVGLIILDLKFPTGDGFALLDQMMAEHQDVRVLVLSAHLGLDSFRNRIRQRGRYPLLAAKADLLREDRLSSVDRFLETVNRVLAANPSDDFSDPYEDAERDVENLDPFMLSPQAFEELDELDQVAIRDVAEELLLPTVHEHFEGTSDDWVLYCGDGKAPVRVGRAGEPEPSDSELEAEAERYGGIPFLFSRGIVQRTEDGSKRDGLFGRRRGRRTVSEGSLATGGRANTAGQDRCPAPGMRNYPTFVLRFADAAPNRRFHFDTGADEHVLRAADLTEDTAHRFRILLRRSHPTRYGVCYYWEVDSIDAILLHQDRVGETLSVTLNRCVAVDSMEVSHVARFCVQEGGCTFTDGDGNIVEINDPGVPCVLREGVIGRSVTSDNGLEVVIGPDRTIVRRVDRS